MRKALFAVLVRMVLRIFYRRWEIVGLENVPETGACLVVSNHNNALVDPLVVGSVMPREIRYMAKATLWKMPVVRPLLELSGAIPVVRPQDLKEMKESPLDAAGQNRQAMTEVHRVLDEGGCVGMFPEGVSHADHDLKRLRSGAALLAFQHAEHHEFAEILPVLPVGLTWTNAAKFRSDVAVLIGEPLSSEPWHDLYRERGLRAALPLNRRIRHGLHGVTLLGESAVRRRQVERACDFIEEMNRRDSKRYPLPRAAGGTVKGIRLRTWALQYVEELGRNDPERLKALGRAIRRLEALERAAGIEPGRTRRSPAGWTAQLLLTVVTLPLVLAGAILWAPVRYLAKGFASYPGDAPDDVRASNKIFAVIAGAPVWLLVLTVAAPIVFGVWWTALAVAALAPIIGWWALLRIEAMGDLLEAGWIVFRRASVEGALLRRRARVAGLLREELSAAG